MGEKCNIESFHIPEILLDSTWKITFESQVVFRSNLGKISLLALSPLVPLMVSAGLSHPTYSYIVDC